MATTRKQTASEAYQASMTEIEAQMKRLQAALKTHKKEQAAEPKSWGYAGDLDLVRQYLTDAANFLTNSEE